MNKLIEDERLHLAYLLGKSDGIKQGRAEVIDECLDAIDYAVTVNECREAIEELKEQKNEK